MLGGGSIALPCLTYCAELAAVVNDTGCSDWLPVSNKRRAAMSLGYGAIAAEGEDRSLNRLAKRMMPTYTERVSEAITQAEQQLADLKRIQEIFAKHPEFEELLTLVQRGRI
jgi:predicted nucleotidyltransferase